jgi:hypothetical protein
MSMVSPEFRNSKTRNRMPANHRLHLSEAAVTSGQFETLPRGRRK